mgnify:CR=1 FL=1
MLKHQTPKNELGSESGVFSDPGPFYFRRSDLDMDPDPGKPYPDPKPCYIMTFLSLFTLPRQGGANIQNAPESGAY